MAEPHMHQFILVPPRMWSLSAGARHVAIRHVKTLIWKTHSTDLFQNLEVICLVGGTGGTGNTGGSGNTGGTGEGQPLPMDMGFCNCIRTIAAIAL